MKGRKKFLISLLSIAFTLAASVSFSGCDVFLEQILSGVVNPGQQQTPNTPDSPDLPDEPDTPDTPVNPEEPHVHNWEYRVEVTNPTCNDEGYTTYTCSCGDSKTDDFVDALGHNYQISYPTCELDGKITCSNEDCDYEVLPTAQNKTEVIYSKNGLELTGADLEKTGHSEETVEIQIANNNGNICVDGGQLLSVCKACATSNNPDCLLCEDMVVSAQEIQANGHAVTSDWTVRTVPTATQKGAIRGYCEVCKQTVTVTLPTITAENIATQAQDLKYVLNEEKSEQATCGKTGKNVYDISYKGWSGQYTVTFSTTHDYNGTSMSLDKVYTIGELEEIFDFDWDTVTKNELKEIGFYKYGEQHPTCDTTKPVSAGFTCSSCQQNWLIKVVDDHDYKLVGTTVATCDSPKIEHYVCSYNSAHTLDKEVEGTQLSHITELCSTKAQLERGLLVYSCTRDNCDYVSTPKEAYQWQIIQKPEPTCNSKGIRVLQYKATAEDLEYTEIELGEIGYAKHCFVNKQNVSTYIDPDRETPYTVNELNEIFGIDLTTATKAELAELGISIFGNANINCSQDGSVGFVCSHCKTNILIQNVQGNCVYTAESTSYVDETCDTNGHYEKTCTVCNQTVTESKAGALAFGHVESNEIEIQYPTKTASGYAIMTCENNCNQQVRISLPAITAKTISNGTYVKIEELSHAATCTHEGYTTYEFSVDFSFKNGQTFSKTFMVEVEEAMTEHSISEFTLEYNGYKYTNFLCEDCNKIEIHSVEELPDEE